VWQISRPINYRGLTYGFVETACFTSNRDIYLALKNYVASEVPYLLTTTHLNHAGFRNTDIPTGDFR